MSKDKFDIHKSVVSAFSLLESFGVDKDQAREDREKLHKKLSGQEISSETKSKSRPSKKKDAESSTTRIKGKKPTRKSIEQLIEDSPVNISGNFTKIPNQVYDELAKTLTLAEQAVFNQLLRKSLGWGYLKCAVSQSELMERTGISAIATLRNALRGLIDKKYIEFVYYQPPAMTVYKINLKWDEQHNPSKSNLSKINPLENNGLNNNPTNFNGLKNDSSSETNDDGEFVDLTHQDATGEKLTRQNLTGNPSKFNPLTRQNLTGNPSKFNRLDELSKGLDLNEEADSQSSSDQSKETLFKDTFKHTLSKKEQIPELVNVFYAQIGQSRISTRARESAIESYNSLKKEGFMEEDISFAIDWTIQNVKKVRSFVILENTIGQALAERERILDQQALEENMEKERQAELEKRRCEEEESAKLDEYITKLSPAEREALEYQARDELIRKEKIAERFINPMVLGAKVKEIIRREHDWK